MRFEGYTPQYDLPFKQRQVVTIPAGTTVFSTNPRKKKYELARIQQVVIHMFMPGLTLTVEEALGDQWYDSLISRGFDLFALKDENPNKLIPINNPRVVWVGVGGYWCEVDINDILEANGVVA